MRLFTIVFLTSLILSIGLQAEIINVPDDVETIQGGINEAEDGDTVLVAPGEYRENINFNGMVITVASRFLTEQNEDYIENTIIDGGQSGSVVTFENGESDETFLVGLTLYNGSGTDVGGGYRWGGGIYCLRSDPTITNCTIRNNSVVRTGNGGGLYFSVSNSLIRDCIIMNNEATNVGGGVCLIGDTELRMINCLISENTTDGEGGGVWCERSSAQLSEVTITGNSAVHGAGIAIVSDAGLNISRCLITENSADDIGGGIYCVASYDAIIDNCNIISNSANSGGGVACDRSEATFHRCHISENSVRQSGGGFDCHYNSSPLVSYCVISGNSAESHGGSVFLFDDSNPIFLNCTFHSNAAVDSSGGFYCAENSNPEVINSILWDNDQLEVVFMSVRSENSISISYSDINNGQDGIETNDNGEVHWLEGNINTDPLFTDPDEGNYHLTEYSPCIDAGDPESDPDPDGTRADMGAFYFHQGGRLIIVPDDYETISEAIEATSLDGGDTVLVRPGRYVEPNLWIDRGVVLGSLFFTTGEQSYIDSTIIDGDWSACVLDVGIGEGRQDQDEEVQITGFTIRNGGSGVFCTSYEIFIDHCIITQTGHGLYCVYGIEPHLLNCTITENYADNGAGILCEDAGAVVINSILWNNADSEIQGENVAVVHSAVRGGYDGEGNIDSDPLFVNPDEGDFHLTEDSPCIDAGTAFFAWEDDTLINMSEDEYYGEAPDMGTFESDYEGASDPFILHPSSLILHQPCPNPFNSLTTLKYELPSAAYTKLAINDINGRLVDVIVDERLNAGRYTAVWNAERMPSGIYIARLEAGSTFRMVKLMLIK